MKRLLPLLILLAILSPLPSLAFDYNYIISDKELEDYDSMSAQGINGFLSDHNSFLQYFADFYPEDGSFISAAEIIWRTSQKFRINPKFILTLLEKEQSLVSYSMPVMKRLNWAMGYGVCDNCSLSHPLVVQFKGFAKQVYSAAKKIREGYMEDLEANGKINNGFGVGITKKVDGWYKITPVNRATAILYTYTPHIAGNRSFYVLWKNWFSELVYPDGSLLQDVKSGGIYLIENGKKRPFLTKTAFTSRYNSNQIVEATPSFLAKYETGEPIKFDNFSLLQNEDGVVYLLDDERLRPFDSLDTVKALGLDAGDIIPSSKEELKNYAPGDPLDASSRHPEGTLFQLAESGGVYWVWSGIKYPIPDKSVLKTLFPKQMLAMVGEAALEKYPKGEALKFKDGTLVQNKTSPAVYFISDGKLRPIPSEEIFLAYNWKWENIVKTSDKILGLYETGEPITLKNSGENEEAAIAETVPINEEHSSSTPIAISADNRY